MEFYKKEEAAVVVFLLLILVSMLSLIGTFLEIARTQGARLYYQEALNAGVDCIGASYCRELYEEYGLLFYWPGENNPADEIKELLSYYEDPDRDLAVSGIGIYGLEKMDLAVNEITRACDRKQEALKKQMLLLGKAACTAEVLGKLTGELELLQKGMDLKDQIDQKEADYESEDWYEKHKEQMQELPSEQPEKEENAEAEEEDREKFEKELEEKWTSEIWSQIKDFLTHPLETLLIPEGTEISENAFSGETFSLNEIGNVEENLPTAEELSDRIFLSSYIQAHTGNFCSPASESGLRYETEQILFGKNNDRENLNDSLKRLMLLREGMNLIYLLSDDASVALAQEGAMLLVGWTGIAPLAEAMKYILLAVWAAAESTVDVRALLQEKKVPLQKNKETWNLTMENLPLWLAGTWEREEQEGLTYTEYLGLLLLLRTEDTLVARMGGIIQFHMQQYRSEFLLRDCIESMKIDMTAVLGDGFLLVPTWAESARKLHSIRLETRFFYRKEEP